MQYWGNSFESQHLLKYDERKLICWLWKYKIEKKEAEIVGQGRKH